MNNKIKTGFVIANILFLVMLFSTYAFKGVSLFEKENILDNRIPLVIAIINSIFCCLLLLNVIIYRKLSSGRSAFQDRTIMVFGIYALLTILFQQDSIRDVSLVYYMASLVSFGILTLVLFFISKQDKN